MKLFAKVVLCLFIAASAWAEFDCSNLDNVHRAGSNLEHSIKGLDAASSRGNLDALKQAMENMPKEGSITCNGKVAHFSGYWRKLKDLENMVGRVERGERF